MPDMDKIDRIIAGMLQVDSRCSSAELADAAGISVSTASERVRKMAASAEITAWRAVINPAAVGAGLCAFLLIDMAYSGEQAACAALTARPEVQELHHISGAHSYLAKLRVADTAALQVFLQTVVKPQDGVIRTESLIVLDSAKETTEIGFGSPV